MEPTESQSRVPRLSYSQQNLNKDIVILIKEDEHRTDMSKLGWLGLLGLLGLLGVALNDPRWYGLYGLYALYALFALKRR